MLRYWFFWSYELNKKLQINDQGKKAEFTVVQKLNQGVPGNRGNYCRGSFFVTFLEKQKSKEEKIEKLPEIKDSISIF